MPRFVHLNLHTEYSIVDSLIRLEQLLPRCLELKMPAIALTDLSNQFAAIKFYRQSLAQGVKPILGVELWLDDERQPTDPFKIILLAKNTQGYHHLRQLISRSYLEGQYLGVARIKRSWLTECADGLIVLSGAKEGDVGRALLRDDTALLSEYLNYWQQYFPDNYYLEIYRTGRPHDEEYLQAAVDLAERASLPLVATNAVRFLKPDDFEAHEARVCINSGYILTDPQRPHLYSEQQYLRSPEEMQNLFADLPESLANSVEIAKRCNVEITLGKTFLPIFPLPDQETPEKLLITRAQQGLAERCQFTNQEMQQRYQQRLDYEIGIINQMGFASYFLIVADFIQWSKTHGVPVGPGRGSGAGSLVAYALRITDIDPLVHDLLFERFLNPERVSMPDFDVDFCMDGRDRTIDYVMNHYGKEKVAQIATFGTMAAKGVIRDVGRVLGLAYGYVDKLAKLVPFTLGITLDEALASEELLRERYQKEEDARNLIDLAKKLEGLVRNIGKHAGGVVIAPSALTDFSPLYCEEGGTNVITQFDKEDVEKIGLVKFDFLGLRTLTIIDWALEAINRKRCRQNLPPIDLATIPLEDQATYRLLQSGETTAVFQLESNISRDVIKKFLPDRFSDIVALVAIIRPGVLQSGMLDDIIDRKHGRMQIAYMHPLLEPILKPTYGVAIYQEQVMQMAQVLAGYSLGSADLLRRAMGKKKPEEMAKQRAVFTNGAAKIGIDEELANKIFDYMEKFASYGFNKSHSAAYALIAYQTAWLKTHYAAEFLAAVMSSEMDNVDKLTGLLQECQRLNLTVLPPDLNQGEYRFTVSEQGEIIYGLGAIRGVGAAAAEPIVSERIAHGAYRSIFDLCRRVDVSKVNKRVLEALISAGAVDRIGPDRATQFANVESALAAGAQQAEAQRTGQLDLFVDDEVALDDSEQFIVAEPWNDDERFRREKETLGHYLSGHPIARIMDELRSVISHRIFNLTQDSKGILVVGTIQTIKLVNTKTGNRLAVMTIEDDTAAISATVFEDILNRHRELLVKDNIVILDADVAFDNFTNGNRLRINKIYSLAQFRSDHVKGLVINLAAMHDKVVLTQVEQILREYRDQDGCPIFIDYSGREATARLMLGHDWTVKRSGELLDALRAIATIQAKFIY